MAMTARECLELHALYESTPKEVVASNINRIFGYYDIERTTSRFNPGNKRTRVLCKITDTCRYTVLGWMNLSREDVRIPLLKLCVIAETFGVNITDLLSSDPSWYLDNEQLRKRLDILVEHMTEELK